jgi:hypothetical protein
MGIALQPACKDGAETIANTNRSLMKKSEALSTDG